ncbi:DUF7520 family protein [Halobaculum gomorrense]|uniref:Cox cluster protein n=1 Tax=Halobaculum gomorrense TaxID=43928 RepID=A0A1M5UXV5_9EURY|nr:hypothetical protein SAMN05443636_3165 [Halobaculum gomorrense]
MTRERDDASGIAGDPIERVGDATEGTGDASEREPAGRFDGPRLVLLLYAVLTAVGGVAGVLVATFVDGLSAPALYAVIPLPASALGFGIYGAVTIATVLGIPLALVVYVSRGIDDPNGVDE